MKFFKKFVFLFLSIWLFAACSEKAPEPMPYQEVEKIRIDAEKKVQEANVQRKEAEQSKSNIQNIAWGLGVLVIVALLAGIAIGSSARKDSKDRKQNDE